MKALRALKPKIKKLNKIKLEAPPRHSKTLILQPKKILHFKYIYRGYFLEDFFKRIWFDCRSCGQCILSTTGFVCPMRCPKKMRNGICGGSKRGMCEVDTTKRCVWDEIYEGARDLDRIELLERFQKPIDWQIFNTSSFINMFDRRIEGMKIIIPGKVKAFYHVLGVLFHAVKTRWRKLLHPSYYHQKYPSHYLGA